MEISHITYAYYLRRMFEVSITRWPKNNQDIWAATVNNMRDVWQLVSDIR
jgi:hypothetical protein